jgi:hypothetical protein
MRYSWFCSNSPVGSSHRLSHQDAVLANAANLLLKTDRPAVVSRLNRESMLVLSVLFSLSP